MYIINILTSLFFIQSPDTFGDSMVNEQYFLNQQSRNLILNN